MILSHLLGGRKKGRFERFREVVSFGEVLGRVVVRFSENSCFHEVKDDVTEIAATLDVPCIKKRFGHGAILIQRELADAFKQFFPSDVMITFRRVLLDMLKGMIERLTHKVICAFAVTRILLPNKIYNISEIFIAHGIYPA